MNILQQQLKEYRRTDNGEIIQGAAHTSKLLNHKYRNKIIMGAYSYIKSLNIEYTAIACCGASGMLIVPQIAELLKKNIIMIRKKRDGYSEFIVEGVAAKNYIIIDDLICSGKTIKHIVSSIRKETPRSNCVGVYCYIPDECSYGSHPEYCKRDLGVDYL